MQSPPPKAPRRRRRWILIAVAIVIFLGLAEFGISRFLDYKLRATISEHLDAELQLQGLWYIPPLSVHVSGASLYRDEERLLSIGPSRIRLAHIPLPHRPVVIQSASIDDPVVELICDREGFIGGPGFIKTRSGKPRHAPQKLSEILRLRHLELKNGTITYTDQRSSEPLPMTWRDININVALAQKASAQYGFTLGVKNGDAATLDLNGAINVDTFVLDVLKMSLSLDTGKKQMPMALPASLQREIRKYDITGKVAITGHATLPLKDIERSTYSGTLAIDDATAQLPQAGVALDRASARIRIEQARTPVAANGPAAEPATQPAPTATPAPDRPAVILTLQSLDGAADGAHVILDRGTFTFDPKADHWTLGELSGHLIMQRPRVMQLPERHVLLAKYAPEGHIDFTLTGQGPIFSNPASLKHALEYHLLAYPHEVSIAVPKFPRRIEGIGGEIRVEAGIATLENFAAFYGKDQYRLRMARIPLGTLPHYLRIEEISGVAQFDQQPSDYPQEVMKYFHVARPVGSVAAAGWIQLNRFDKHAKPDFNFEISSDHATAILVKWNVPVQNIQTDIFLTQEKLHIPRLEAQALDGHLLGNADANLGEVITYNGAYNLRSAQLERIEEIREANGKKPHPIKGTIFTNGRFSGTKRKDENFLAGLKGDGILEIIHGDFFRLPILHVLLTTAHFGQSVGTVGELATNYSVDQQTITLSNCAVNSPLVGIQGNGKIRFNGDLDLTAIVAPLASWRDKLRETKIPLVSNLAGDIIGGVQKLLNTATSNLLYNFRITGKFNDPKIQPIPVPVVTNTMAFVFGRMVQGVRDGDLLKTVKAAGQQQPPPSNQSTHQ